MLGDLTAEQDVSFDFTLSAQFDNDLFANATQISGANGTLTGTTVGATFPESGEPDPSDAIDNTVWYAWTAPANGPATFTVDTGFDGAAAVYTGGAVDSLVPVADDSDSSALSLQFTAQAGQTYHVQVGTYDDSPDAFTLHWHLTVRPSNDDLTDATTIDGSSIDGTTKNATLESLEPTNVDVSGTPHTGSNSVWYRWSPGDTGSAELTVTPHVEIDNPHNALVQVYDGPASVLSFDDLTPVGTHPSADTTDADVETGSFYYVQVMSNDTPTNPNFDFTLDIQVSTPAPPNDDWANAAAISEDAGSTDGTNVDATTEAGEPLALHTPSVVATHDTVWWKWVAPSDGRYQFDTADSELRHGARRLHGFGRERADRDHVQRRRQRRPLAEPRALHGGGRDDLLLPGRLVQRGRHGALHPRMEPPARRTTTSPARPPSAATRARSTERTSAEPCRASPTRRAATSRIPSGTRGRRRRPAAPRSRSTPGSSGRLRSTRGARSTRSRGWRATTTEPRSQRRSMRLPGGRITSRSEATSTRPARSRSTGASPSFRPRTTW